MDMDDVTPKMEEPLSALEREDLDGLSIEELNARIARLKAEIDRSENAIAGKQDTKAAAESLFSKK